MNLFDYNASKTRMVTADNLWLFWVITVPLTFLVLVVSWVWTSRTHRSLRPYHTNSNTFKSSEADKVDIESPSSLAGPTDSPCYPAKPRMGHHIFWRVPVSPHGIVHSGFRTTTRESGSECLENSFGMTSSLMLDSVVAFLMVARTYVHASKWSW